MNNQSIINNLSDKAILELVGNFIQYNRIKLNMTQNELTRQAAISRSTLSLMEGGENGSLINLIKVLRSIDALYVLNSFKVPEELSPLQLAKGEKKQRQRASKQSESSKNKNVEW